MRDCAGFRQIQSQLGVAILDYTDCRTKFHLLTKECIVVSMEMTIVLIPWP